MFLEPNSLPKLIDICIPKMCVVGGVYLFEAQADLIPVLDYLAGCKHLQLPGRWESWNCSGVRETHYKNQYA